MAENCGRVGIVGNGANVLANRWFQPLTHVSEARSPRETAKGGQGVKREKRGLRGLSWHSSRHNTFPRRSAKRSGPECCGKQHPALPMTQRSCAVAMHFIMADEADQQQHYRDLAFHRRRVHDILADKNDDVCAYGFLLYAQELGLPDNLPVPPAGLPGHNAKVDPLVMGLIREGVRYALALADGEKKTLWNVHDKLAQVLLDSYWRGRNDEKAENEAERADEYRREALRTGQESPEGFVYFIQSAAGGIKIGLARDIGRRLKELQTAHPVKLEVLASTTGGQPQEIAYHRQFAAHRLHGEWFSPSPDILAEIERLRS